ncbi:MAG: hypothetical protein KDA80_07810 [Planctomycetaceae bacterium]|nr:hypothetical protein [Planctomycetaceae bacterium]
MPVPSVSFMPVQPLLPESVLPPSSPSSPTAASSTLMGPLVDHPLCVLLGERFANQWADSTNQETGDVNDVILGAVVTGTQRTDSHVFLDIAPNANVAQMQMVLDGIIDMETTSTTPQATICSNSGFQFNLTKRIEFPGDYLQTWTPNGFFTGGQQHNGADTRFSGIPIAGQIARRIAINTANEQKSLSTEISARKISDRVGPQFNNEVDQQIYRLNTLLMNRIRPELEKREMVPERVTTLSTDTVALAAAAYGPAEPGRTLPDLSQIDLSNRAVILVHESLVAQLAQRHGLHGLEIPDVLLRDPFRLLSQDSSSPPNAELATIVLDSQQPLSTEFRDGEILFRSRVSFRPVIGPELEAQEITIAITPTVADGRAQVESRLVSIEPASGEKNPTISQILDKAVRPKIEEQLKPIDREVVWRTFQERTGRPIRVRLESVRSENGWLTFEISAEKSPSTPAPHNAGYGPSLGVPFGPSPLPLSIGEPFLGESQPFTGMPLEALPPGSQVAPVPISPTWQEPIPDGPVLPPLNGF